MANFKIGVMTDSFKLPFEQGLAKAAEVGAQGIQLYVVEGENKYDFPSELIRLGEGEMFLAELDAEGLPTAVEPLPEETAARRRELHSRTAALFRRNKKN